MIEVAAMDMDYATVASSRKQGRRMTDAFTFGI